MHKPPEYRPWYPYEWEKDIPGVRAVQAVAAGVANEGQQRQAIETILQISRIDDFPYIPDSDRDTNIALGKSYVGHQLIKLMKLKSTIIQEAENERSGKRRPERHPKRDT